MYTARELYPDRTDTDMNTSICTNHFLYTNLYVTSQCTRVLFNKHRVDLNGAQETSNRQEQKSKEVIEIDL